jgi:mono/diheme cytochrome c family protein
VNWAEKIDLTTGRPADNPRTRYLKGALSRLSAGPNGGHTWQPMAFNPTEGLVYIPAHRDGFTYKRDSAWQFVRGRWNLALEGAFGPLGPPDTRPVEKLSAGGESVLAKLPRGGGYLIAWDPVKQQPRWIAPEDNSWTGGALATAGGLVFAGSDNTFNAYDAATGAKLWTDRTAAAVMAAPATYALNGEQYIAVAVGYGGADAMIGGRFPRRPGRIYAYRLGGTVKASEFAPHTPQPPLDPATLTASTGNAAKGGKLMGEWCLSCHIGGIFTPDLSRSPRIATPELFRQVVHDGALKQRGMASFASWLSERDVEDIRAALLNQARSAR